MATLHQHQRCTQTERGYTRGASSAHILVADYQLQDWSGLRTRAGITNPPQRQEAVMASCHRIPDRRAVSSPAAAVSRVRGSLRFASGTYSYGARLQPRSILSATGSNRSRAHTCPMKPSYQLRAYRVTIHPNDLSRLLVSMSPTSNGRMPKKCHSLTGSDQCTPL